MMVQILLMSADASACHGLEEQLTQDEKVKVIVDEASCIEEGQFTTFRHIDFVLIDIHLLGNHRNEQLASLRRQLPYAKVIVLTPYHLESEAIELAHQHADGFLTKTYDHKGWQSIVFHPSEQQSLVESYFISHIIPRILNWKTNVRVEEQSLEREWKLLQLKEKGKSHEEIAKDLYLTVEEVAHHIAIIEKTLGRSLSA